MVVNNMVQRDNDLYSQLVGDIQTDAQSDPVRENNDREILTMIVWDM